MKKLLLCVCCTLASHYSQGFLAPQLKNTFSFRSRASIPLTHKNALQQDAEEKTINTNDEAARLMKEAEIMRLEAEKMDLSLTLDKMKQIEAKLDNRNWLQKNPDKEAELQTQLQNLNFKLQGKQLPDEKILNKRERNVDVDQDSVATIDDSISLTPRSAEKYSPPSTQISNKKLKTIPKIPLAGFDDSDLELYIPIARDIDKMIPNATIEEKLESFRTAPELQAHFQEKIKNMLVLPLEEIQELETLKKNYLDSTSSKERETLKREMERLEAQLEDDTPFLYSESFYCEDLKPLSDEELALRLEAVGSLPDILKAIYKQRNGLDDKDDLRLAIEMDYYEPQLQLLEQAGFVDPFTDEMRDAYMKGYNSLPSSVQNRFCRKYGVEAGADASKVLKVIKEGETPTSAFMEVVQAASELPEYNDIDFVDRSRFLEEFYPSIGRMEGDHPSLEDVEEFASKVLDRSFFMVTSKPERVAGGFYIRGQNQLSDDEDKVLTAADKLVSIVSEKMEDSKLGDKLEFFYILDPSPPTDEELEFGPIERPLFVVTTKNPKKFYSWAKPTTKTVTTLSGLLTTFFFSVGACALNPSISDHFTSTLDAASSTGVIDFQWLVDLFLPILGGTLAIQFAHEMSHQLVALRYKFDAGFPNVIPSITTGTTGAITPLKSPPPNTKALFDFGIAGPMAGLMVSFILLLQGLEMTSTMDMNTQLPVLPVDLIRSSSLGGGMVQFFLGSAVVMPDQGAAALVGLHPLAVAGFMGCITNALALLPLGHTDGGRISVAMFGRRGAFVVKLFTTLLLCVAGIFGLDDSNILLTYALFTSIWQRELETPMRNEVDELDFMRGFLGISVAILVGLTLIPMF